jgi:type II secretory pathway pseudopilin PulG
MIFYRKGIQSKKKRNYSLFSKNKKGLTIIESLMALSILAITITGLLILVNEYSKQTTLRAFSNDFVSIMNAVARRTQHDGYSFQRWQENGNRASDGNDFIAWTDNDEVVDEFFGRFLVAQGNTTCGINPEGWQPHEYSAPESMSSKALVSCILFENRIPLQSEISAILFSDGNADDIEQVSTFKMYLDMDVSSLNEEEDGVIYIADLKRYIESNFNQNFDTRPSSMTVEFGDKNVLTDEFDDAEFTAFQCSQAISTGNNCDLILSLDFSGATNDVYLRTDGANSMLNGIDFRDFNAPADPANPPLQKCIWWQNPDANVSDYSRNSGGVAVSVSDRWEAKEVDCGIFGGEDSKGTVEVVVGQQYANKYLVSAANLDHYCRVYEATVDGEFIDIPDANEDSRVPCGIMEDGGIVQLAVENAFIGQAYIKDLIVQDIFSNSLEIVNSIGVDQEVEDNLKLGSTAKILEDYAPEPNILINIMDENRVQQFTVDSSGYTHVMGELEVDENGVFRQDLLVEGNFTSDEIATFNMNGGSDVIFGAGNELIFNNGGTNFDQYTRSGVNFNIIADDATLTLNGEAGVRIISDNGDIDIENNNPAGDVNVTARGGDVVIDSSSGAYYSKNTLTDTYINRVAFDALDADNKKDLELLNYGFGKYLDDKSGNISIHSTVNIESGSGNIIAKPDCLDFVRNNTTGRYASTNALSRAINNEGYDLARLFILPLYFKTYAAALGNNQIFSQHAVHTGSDEWEVYMYLSGEGIQGTGGREDAAGSAIGLIVCDYNGVNFEG